jgi:hypothetical protein
MAAEPLRTLLWLQMAVGVSPLMTRAAVTTLDGSSEREHAHSASASGSAASSSASSSVSSSSSLPLGPSIPPPPSMWNRLWSLLQMLLVSPLAACVSQPVHSSASIPSSTSSPPPVPPAPAHRPAAAANPAVFVPGPLLKALPLTYLLNAMQYAFCLQHLGMVAIASKPSSSSASASASSSSASLRLPASNVHLDAAASLFELLLVLLQRITQCVSSSGSVSVASSSSSSSTTNAAVAEVAPGGGLGACAAPLFDAFAESDDDEEEDNAGLEEYDDDDGDACGDSDEESESIGCSIRHHHSAPLTASSSSSTALMRAISASSQNSATISSVAALSSSAAHSTAAISRAASVGSSMVPAASSRHLSFNSIPTHMHAHSTIGNGNGGGSSAPSMVGAASSVSGISLFAPTRFIEAIRRQYTLFHRLFLFIFVWSSTINRPFPVITRALSMRQHRVSLAGAPCPVSLRQLRYIETHSCNIYVVCITFENQFLILHNVCSIHDILTCVNCLTKQRLRSTQPRAHFRGAWRVRARIAAADSLAAGAGLAAADASRFDPCVCQRRAAGESIRVSDRGAAGPDRAEVSGAQS